MYESGLVATLSVEDFEGWVVFHEAAQDDVGGVRGRDVEDNPSGGVRWRCSVVGQRDYGAIERKRRHRGISLGTGFGGNAYDSEVGAVVDANLIQRSCL